MFSTFSTEFSTTKKLSAYTTRKGTGLLLEKHGG